MKLCSTALTMIALGLALSSCGLLDRKGKEDESPERSDSNLIGVIEMVNPEQRFVLIRTESRMSITAGQEVIAVDAQGAESKLKITPEKKPHYLTADIVNGDPKTGSLVVVQGGSAVAAKDVQPTKEPSGAPNLVPLPVLPEQPPPLVQTAVPPIPPQSPTPELAPVTESALPPIVR